MKKRQLIIQIFLIGLVFAFFAFFRFYNLDKRIGFDWDQEQFSTQIKEIIVNHKLTLLGPRVVGDNGFYLAPYFSYFLIPFYLLTNLHPSALIYFVLIFNMLFFGITFYVLKKIFSFYHAVGFFFLWSCNSFMVANDTTGWWPIAIPLGIILTWLSLYEISRTRSIRGWLGLGITWGIFANMHFQFVFIILFSLVFLVYLFFINKKIRKYSTNIFITLFTFIFFLLPLFLFDLRHNFLNLNLFGNFFFSKEAGIGRDFNIWATVFGHIVQSFVYFQSNFTTKLFYFIFLGLFYYLSRQKNAYQRIFYLATLTLWLIFPFCFALYGKRPSEYYFIFIFPFIIIAIVDFSSIIKKNYLLYLFLIFFFVINWKNTKDLLNPNLISLNSKDQAVKRLKELTLNKKFNVTLDTPLGQNSGYRYLINYYQIKQTGNWNDPLVEIRIPPKKDDIIVQGIGIKIPKELK